MTTQRAELIIVREFDAPKEVVFKAFSTAEAVGEWWGPAECTNTVVKFDFRPKGIFHFKMQAPDHVMWGRIVYVKIMEPDLIELINSFADEKGEKIKPSMLPTFPLEIYYRITFTEKQGKTILKMVGKPVDPNDEEIAAFLSLEANMQMGFKATFDQLEHYLNAQFKLRKDLKTDTKSRTSTYLNFNGNTEEAFKFYQSVFKTEFNGNGVQRFGDIPPQAGHPPVAEEIKKMVLHVELPILGGHVLMGTDAPEEMGFKLNFGNNSHICLEPDSREEAKRLFDALSTGGNISMPLQDMFFGAYFGEFTDKYGVSWMVNHTSNK